MKNYSEMVDLLPDYLANNLSPESHAEVEAELKRNAMLRSELEDLIEFISDIDLANEYADDHIDSEDLAEYAEENSSLDIVTIRWIESHLAECEKCNSELDKIRIANKLAAAYYSEGTANEMCVNWLVSSIRFELAIPVQPDKSYGVEATDPEEKVFFIEKSGSPESMTVFTIPEVRKIKGTYILKVRRLEDRPLESEKPVVILTFSPSDSD